MSENKRNLVSIRTVKNITPIEKADAIETAHIDGWTCVVKKGEFKPGDKCVFFEIDSFLPEEDERFAFLMKNTTTFKNKRGVRIRTMKLRGQLSQGLALPLDKFPELSGEEKGDLSQKLGVVKWEPNIPACIAGEVAGAFPSFIPKTDEERVQNLLHEVFHDNLNEAFEVSLKLDGTSCTMFHNRGEVGVCSRNWKIKLNEANKNNVFVKVATKSGILDRLAGTGMNVAVQGEIMGPGIQKNRENLDDQVFFVFNIYDIDQGKFFSWEERLKFFDKYLSDLSYIQHVPLIGTMTVGEAIEKISGSRSGPEEKLLNSLLAFADGPSINNKVREGLVWKRVDGRFSFKTINNRFLLKGGD